MEQSFQVFLSYSSTDQPAVEEIASGLKAEGIEVWFDKWVLTGGDHYVARLPEAIDACPVVAVFTGPHRNGPWQTAEVEHAINLSIQSRGSGAGKEKRIIPVLLPGAGKDAIPALIRLNTLIEFPSTTDAEALRLLIRAIKGLPPGPSPDTIPVTGERPYRGLAPFDFEDARFFAGRDAVIESLGGIVENCLKTKSPALIGILGDSGSGKSSLARAGLLPALENGSGDLWKHAIMMPGSSPLQNLALALLGVNDEARDPVRAAELKRNLAADKTTLALTAASVLAPYPGVRLAILVDQFEETFSICADEVERKQFIGALMHACSISDSRVLIVLTLRTDFYGACAAYPEFAPVLNHQHILLGPMSADEMEQAIEKPALRAGFEMEAGLAAMLLRDAQDQPGCLPLLQFALDELWRKRMGRRMTLDAYQEIGGLGGALNNRAEELYNQFSAEQQAVLRTILLRLVQIGDDGRLLRTRVPVKDLCSSSDRPERAQVVQQLLDRLSSRESRLIRITALETADSSNAEVAHEALIRDWKRLRGWLDEGENRRFVMWRQRFQVLVANWRESNDDPETYLRGTMLAQALRWRTERPDDFSEGEARFIEVSRAAQAMNEVRTRRRKWIVWAQTGAVIAAISALAFVVLRPPGGDQRIETARSLLESNPTLAMVIALRVNLDHPTERSSTMLQQAFQRATLPPIDHGDQEITALSFSSDGQRIATGSRDGTAVLWDSNGRKMLGPVQAGSPVIAVQALSSASNAALAAVSEKGLVRRWAMPNGAEVTTADLHRALSAATLSPDGNFLAGACADGKVCIWTSGKSEPDSCYAGMPDAKLIAWGGGSDPKIAVAGDSAECLILSVRSGVRISIPLHENMIASASFDSSARRLAVAARLGAAWLWNANSGAQIGDAVLPEGRHVTAAALSADGQWLATANSDGSVALWSTARRKTMRLIPGQTSSGMARIGLSPDAKRIAISGENGKARLFEMDDAQLNRLACEFEWDLPNRGTEAWLDACSSHLRKSECAVDCRKKVHMN